MLFPQLLQVIFLLAPFAVFKIDDSSLFAKADVYMHNPRGSNDRNCERNVNRDNGNRLFNSQNNNNGGYACPRGVGDENFQSEEGIAVFDLGTDDDGGAQFFYQNKRMYYYSGSVLPIEWTDQHGCGGNSKVTCEIVLQYACEDTLDPKVDDFWPWVQNKAQAGTTYRGKQHFRYYDATTGKSHIAAPRDGVPNSVNDAATDTINDDEASAIPSNTNTRRYGMQESYDYYQVCQRTERNKGVYTADQLIRRTDRRGTRQNPNGNRHGFECPEERDYYPWWAPAPWVDIAILTDDAGDGLCSYSKQSSCTKRCQYYLNNTMNYNNKGYCDANHATGNVNSKLTHTRWQNNQWFNNKADCLAANFQWYEVSHADNLNIPKDNFVCAHTQFARVNQLGNAFNEDIFSQSEAQTLGNVENTVVHGVNANRFMWTIPDIPTSPTSYFTDMTSAYKSCVLRLRYNISSADFQPWPQDAVDPGTARMVDSKNNSKTDNDPNTPLTQDPYIYIAPGDKSGRGDQFVSLAVNTNQYARTFQDRSYVFTIKPLNLSANATTKDVQTDTPAINYPAIKNAITNGGKIYNVNVRGKRGNIVQVYPSVEYDFVPNALALSTHDMIHFQWTGSDYNPRRGCNDGEGGPPDLNTYSTATNADQNSRADRSNVVFTMHMANNVPRDYLGYDHSNTSIPYKSKVSIHRDTISDFAPCFNSSDSKVMQEQCIDTVKWLAYLNQQMDKGSLTLRAGKSCLTQTELDALGNQQVAENHPLNCAKLNAKPYPYFDGGVMFMRKSGWFPFFSSRNNNFSNRQQIGIICVGKDCKIDNSTGVLQDRNPLINGLSVTRAANSKCYNTANGEAGATANGAMSCIPASSYNVSSTSYVLKAETFTIQNGDNDNLGDGNKQGCSVLTFTAGGIEHSVEQQVALAFILLGVGMFSSWLAYYLYNRYMAYRANYNPLRKDTSWQAEVEQTLKAHSTIREGEPTMSLPAASPTSSNSFKLFSIGSNTSSVSRGTSSSSRSLSRPYSNKTEMI